MTIPRPFRVALLILLAGAAPCRADEAADRLVAVFRSICLVKPDSIWVIGALAAAHGFKPGGIGVAAPAQIKAADQYNLLNTWQLGEGKAQIRLTGLTGGSLLKYQILCEMDAADLSPDDVIAAVKTMPIVGEPQMHKHKEGTGVTLLWKVPADPRQASLSVDYDPGKGRQLIGVGLQQDIDTLRAK